MREDGKGIYGRLGLDLSTAMRIFLKRSVAVRGLPFGMTLSDEEFASDAEAMKLSASLMDKNERVYKEFAK